MNVKECIANANFDNAFDLLNQQIELIENDIEKNDFKKFITILLSNYNSNKNNELKGLDFDNSYKSKAAIGLLELNDKISQIKKYEINENTLNKKNKNTLKYIENRTWLSGCDIIKSNISKLKDLSFLTNTKLTIFCTENLTLVNNCNSMFIYEYFQFIDIELNLKGIREFNERFINSDYYEIISFKIKILETGLINTIAVFNYKNNQEIEFVSAEAINLVNIIYIIETELPLLIDCFIQHKILSKNDFYYFAVPKFIENEEITVYNSYSAIFNVFVCDASYFQGIVDNYNLKDKIYDYKDLKFVILPGNDVQVWYGKFDPKRSDYLNIDFITSTEENIYFKLIKTVQFALKYINLKHSALNIQFRLIFNYLNEIILSIKYLNHIIDMYDKQLFSILIKEKKISEQYKLYSDTEERIKFAIEGIEAKNKENNDRLIQNILALFTGLSLFSVINDIFSFLGNSNLFVNNLLGFKIGLLSFAFLIITSVLYYINRKTKK